MLTKLKAGTTVLSPDGQAITVDADLASSFKPGDQIVASQNGQLLHIPVSEKSNSDDAVSAAVQAFDAMNSCPDKAIVEFYGRAAARLEDDTIWNEIAEINAGDVASAKQRGRSTTRLAVSDAMRRKMTDGLRGWSTMPSRRGAVLESIEHEDFRIEMVGAALGVIAFVFEGRPNVLTDACGVLRGGNTVVFRIGGDALATAQCIMDRVVSPALVQAGLPEGAVSLVRSTAHSAGWSLFLDRRVALAVARGSGPAVDLLGSLARTVGTPVSLHGTGGAWMVVSSDVDDEQLQRAVLRSLDRKVCNTLNTCCIVGQDATHRAEVVLQSLQRASDARNQPFKLHVAKGSEFLVPQALFESKVEVIRAEGPTTEFQAELLPTSDLGIEWEWEESPEITICAADTIEDAVSRFNSQSPRLVGTLLSNDPDEHERFFAMIDAPFVGDDHTRWVDGQYALNKPELGLSNWQNGRLFARGGVLTGDSVYTVRTRYVRT